MCSLLEVKLPSGPSCPSIGRSVSNYFIWGREVTLPCFYRSTLFLFTPLPSHPFSNLWQTNGPTIRLITIKNILTLVNVWVSQTVSQLVGERMAPFIRDNPFKMTHTQTLLYSTTYTTISTVTIASITSTPTTTSTTTATTTYTTNTTTPLLPSLQPPRLQRSQPPPPL